MYEVLDATSRHRCCFILCSQAVSLPRQLLVQKTLACLLAFLLNYVKSPFSPRAAIYVFSGCTLAVTYALCCRVLGAVQVSVLPLIVQETGREVLASSQIHKHFLLRTVIIFHLKRSWLSHPHGCLLLRQYCADCSGSCFWLADWLPSCPVHSQLCVSFLPSTYCKQFFLWGAAVVCCLGIFFFPFILNEWAGLVNPDIPWFFIREGVLLPGRLPPFLFQLGLYIIQSTSSSPAIFFLFLEVHYSSKGWWAQPDTIHFCIPVCLSGSSYLSQFATKNCMLIVVKWRSL